MNAHSIFICNGENWKQPKCTPKSDQIGGTRELAPHTLPLWTACSLRTRKSKQSKVPGT